MRLSTYIQRTRALGDANVPPHQIDALAEEVERGAGLAELLKHKSLELPARLILGIWRSALRNNRHQASLEAVAEARRGRGEPPIPPAVLKQTLNAAEVRVLSRAEAMAPTGSVAEHRRRDAIKEAIALWAACLLLGRRDGVAEVTLNTEDAELGAEFGELTGKNTLAEIAGHRWQAIRRGQAAGALKLTLRLPTEAFVGQLAARGAELSALAQGRKPEELLRELVLVDLEAGVLAAKDDEATLLATRNAATAYLNLLTAPRPTQNTVAGIWIGKGRLGVAVVGRDGRLLSHNEGPLGDSPMADAEKLLGEQVVEAVVLPTQADDQEVLNALAAGFMNVEVLRVKPTAISAGVEAAGDEGLPAAAARAAVLARRSVRPMKYWGQVDPLALGLAEYQHDLNGDDLRAALEEMRVLAQAGVKPSDLARPQPQAAAKPKLPAKPLNPLIKSVEDLRPGLQLNGVITNITQFGAFVNIGLSHEGLVHVSELADHFVNDPNEVVRVGQTVAARVLGVDRARRRISLSLRADRPAPGVREVPEPGGQARRVRLDDIPGGRGGGARRSAGGGGGGGGFGAGGDRGAPAATGVHRSQALADLEALFNKKK